MRLIFAPFRPGIDLEALTRDLEVISADVFATPGALPRIRELRNKIAHSNDFLILESAGQCDVLLTYDQQLLSLGAIAKVDVITPETFFLLLRDRS